MGLPPLTGEALKCSAPRIHGRRADLEGTHAVFEVGSLGCFVAVGGEAGGAPAWTRGSGGLKRSSLNTIAKVRAFRRQAHECVWRLSYCDFPGSISRVPLNLHPVELPLFASLMERLVIAGVGSFDRSCFLY